MYDVLYTLPSNMNGNLSRVGPFVLLDAIASPEINRDAVVVGIQI